MGESSQLTLLSTFCKQPGPNNLDFSAIIISVSIKYHFFFIQVDKSNFLQGI